MESLHSIKNLGHWFYCPFGMLVIDYSLICMGGGLKSLAPSQPMGRVALWRKKEEGSEERGNEPPAALTAALTFTQPSAHRLYS